MEKLVPFREKIVFLTKAFPSRPLVDTYSYYILGNTNAMKTKQMFFGVHLVKCGLIFTTAKLILRFFCSPTQ